MKKVLIISPHADDEVLSSWTYLVSSKNHNISLHIIYQAVNEEERIEIIKELSDNMNFTYSIPWKGWDSKMDRIGMREIISYYDKVLNNYDEIIIPCLSFHQDHRIAHRACLSALRRNNTSSIMVSEHPFNISYFIGEYNPNRYVAFNNIDEKVKCLEKYMPYLKRNDIDTMIKLNSFRGMQIDKSYAETFQVIRELL